jgi:RAQPRD family integrative conjugative element protein
MRYVGPIAKLTRQFLAVGILGAVFLVRPTLADTEGERAALSRLAQELGSLEPIIRTAESQADPDTRIQFRYDWLREDLDRVRRGIQDHIDAPRTELRSFPPLRGDYRQ